MSDRDKYDGYHKYDRAVAENYDKDRIGEAHWWREDRFIAEFFAEGSHDRLLDLPVGTGRFFPHYRNVKEVTGVDISEHMLEEARKNMARLSPGTVLRLERGDVFALRFGNGEFNVAVVWRLLHLIPEDLLPRAIGELCRVTSESIVVQTYAQPQSLRASLRRSVAGIPGLRRLKRGIASLAGRSGARRSMGVDDATKAWSHIQSFTHRQAFIDSLFGACGFFCLFISRSGSLRRQ